jgi:hypothetical protein
MKKLFAILLLLPALAGASDYLRDKTTLSNAIYSVAIQYGGGALYEGSYFVNAATGDDANDGSSSAPWATLDKASSAATNATIYVAPGTYADPIYGANIYVLAEGAIAAGGLIATNASEDSTFVVRGGEVGSGTGPIELHAGNTIKFFDLAVKASAVTIYYNSDDGTGFAKGGKTRFYNRNTLWWTSGFSASDIASANNGATNQLAIVFEASRLAVDLTLSSLDPSTNGVVSFIACESAVAQSTPAILYAGLTNITVNPNFEFTLP